MSTGTAAAAASRACLSATDPPTDRRPAHRYYVCVACVLHSCVPFESVALVNFRAATSTIDGALPVAVRMLGAYAIDVLRRWRRRLPVVLACRRFTLSL